MTDQHRPTEPSPARRDRQRALNDWFTQWAQQHGVDQVDDAPADAQEQYWRRARELMGLDPDTGLRPGLVRRRRRA
ncbi:hypothetical protein [Actinomadura gamaensis]|uniref:Uncharacterized protein n=1 Tax=Actinomadura gamaensis TaxID=1763541 RepID=A0ABV9U9J7_9ACTN